MAYPDYNITFQSESGAATVTTTTGQSGPIETDGSHTFVLDVNGTRLMVELSHESLTDPVPRLILTFK